MSGGILQLVAYGAQDLYITGQPQITFFKTVYRRHTMFSMESIQQTFNGSVGFGNRVTSTISRNGDLLHKLWVVASLTKTATEAATSALGHRLLKSVELEIGGQRIDKHYSEWLQIWSELTMPAEKKTAYDTLVGAPSTAVTAATALTLYVPLQFWFCRNVGLALPLIALQYHEVKVNIEFAAASQMGLTTAPTGLTAELWADYIYLDVDERKRFAQVSHEYLIDQLQFVGSDSVASGASVVSSKLSFNHPVKELVWIVQQSSNGLAQAVVDSVQLKLNGHDRFSQRPGRYFSQVQPFQHHTSVPSGSNVYVYSFALKPEEHQPSGTCNFSRIDNASLILNMNSST
jgi:hypothetical protein